jgi:hypothetical protein
MQENTMRAREREREREREKPTHQKMGQHPNPPFLTPREETVEEEEDPPKYSSTQEDSRRWRKESRPKQSETTLLTKE